MQSIPAREVFQAKVMQPAEDKNTEKDNKGISSITIQQTKTIPLTYLIIWVAPFTCAVCQKKTHQMKELHL
jgi:hypothetical protein